MAMKSGGRGAQPQCPFPRRRPAARSWRSARRMSQLDLALEADLSYPPSELRRNRQVAARAARCWLASPTPSPCRCASAIPCCSPPATRRNSRRPTSSRRRWKAMSQAIELIIAHQEPYPAFVVSRHFDVLMVNGAAQRVNNLVMRGKKSAHANLLRQVFDPDDIRQRIVNWPEVAQRFLRHLHADIAATPSDETARALLDEVLAFPGVPARWRFRDVVSEAAPVVYLVFGSELGELRFFETITTFAEARDVTLDELRIECAFPADAHTAEVCAELACL